MTASVASHNQIFIGIDVGGLSFEAAWHRGGSTQYQNRPDAIAAFVARLSAEKQIIRIAVEPTGGHEKALVKALRGAGLPVEMVHTSRFAAYRKLIGAKAKSDTSDARLLAAYAAAPEEVRGRKAGHVVLPQDDVREQLAELAARRDQLKHMIHAETCRLSTVRSPSIRDEITAHLQALRQADRKTHDAMMLLVRQRDELRNAKRLLQTIPGFRLTARPAMTVARGSISRESCRFNELLGARHSQRDVAVAAAGRVSPRAIHAFGSVWDCRFTKR